MGTTCNKFGLLFGSLIDVCFAIVAVTVVGILVNHNSGTLLENLKTDVDKDFNVTVPETMLVNSTDELQTSIGGRNVECSNTNAIYVTTKNTLDTLTIDALNKTLNDTISGCMDRITKLEQLVALVGMELTPNLPTVIQSGNVMASLDGAGNVATTYSVNRINFGLPGTEQLGMTYLLFPPWASGISTTITTSSTLRFNGFSPSLVNLGLCTGARPILVNRFDGIAFASYEVDCSVAGGEIRLYGPGVTAGGGVLQLNRPLNLLSQFL